MAERDPQTTLADQFVVDTPVVGFPWRLMVFSIILFVFTLFIFFGIKFGYASYLSKRQENLKAEIAALGKKVNPDDQEKYINFYSQTMNLKKVFDNHEFSGNMFKFLENKTAVNVYYTNASYKGDSLSITLQGVAATSEALVQQLSVFDAAPELRSAVLTQMRYTETGKVSFEVELAFKDTFFLKPVQ